MVKTLYLAGALAVVLPALIGCGARHEYRAGQLALERIGWDSLEVDITFVRSTVLGGGRPVEADDVTILVFDARYETLYSGPTGGIPLPDHRLADRERITVEACGVVRSRHICQQDMLHASPKRLTMDEEIDYPTGSDLAEGRYDFTFHAERQVYGGDGWERIDPEGVNGFLLAWVDDRDAKEAGTVRIPFTGAAGNFDLRRHGNYRNFRYYLDSQILDEDVGRVNFEVYAGVGDTVQRLAAVQKDVQRRSEGDREEDVRYFVEQATERLIDELGSFLGGRGATAFVNEWDYNRQNRTYRISMEAEWEGPIFNGRELEIAGVLQVRDDGRDATFDLRSGNRRALRRWRDRIRGNRLTLGRLDTPNVVQSAQRF